MSVIVELAMERRGDERIPKPATGTEAESGAEAKAGVGAGAAVVARACTEAELATAAEERPGAALELPIVGLLACCLLQANKSRCADFTRDR